MKGPLVELGGERRGDELYLFCTTAGTKLILVGTQVVV